MFNYISPKANLIMKSIADDENITINYSCAQSIGQRLTQEDRYLVIKLNYGTLAVIADGHGGQKSADDVIRAVANYVNEEYEVANQEADLMIGLSQSDEKQVMRRVTKRLNDLTQEDKSGTTLSIVFVRSIARDKNNQRQLRISMSVLGDSPVSVFEGTRYVHMPLHTAKYYKPDIERIEKSGAGYFSGGSVYNFEISLTDNKCLAVTRALGNKHLKDVLIRQPNVKCLDVGTEAVIVFGSDGVLSRTDPISVKSRMRNFIKQVQEGKSSSEILNYLGSRPDNTTLITIRFLDG